MAEGNPKKSTKFNVPNVVTSKTRPHYPTTLNVCGNVIKVKPDGTTGEADPKRLLTRRREAKKRGRLGLDEERI